MSEVKGKVRVVPAGTPGLPPGAFPRSSTDVLNFTSLWCGAELPVTEAPVPHKDTDRSWICTRSPHDAKEIHVCDFGHDPDQAEHIIVWGGE